MDQQAPPRRRALSTIRVQRPRAMVLSGGEGRPAGLHEGALRQGRITRSAAAPSSASQSGLSTASSHPYLHLTRAVSYAFSLTMSAVDKNDGKTPEEMSCRVGG